MPLCHVTTEGHILIAGERSGSNIAWWELRKYDEKVEYQIINEEINFPWPLIKSDIVLKPKFNDDGPR